MTDDLTTESRQDGLTRRSVVKTGANLAWAVPAVSIATAAPALAVSPPPEEPITPPAEGEQNQDASVEGNKATVSIPMGTAQEDLVPGDIIVTVKTKGKATGGGSGYAKNPAAGRREEFTFVLDTPVSAGSDLPDFQPNIKRFRKNGKKRFPKKSRYFVTDSAGQLLFTGVISVNR